MALFMKSNRTIFAGAQPSFLRVSTADVPFTTCARNLGFMISGNMTLDKHILIVSSSAYVESEASALSAST